MQADSDSVFAHVALTQNITVVIPALHVLWRQHDVVVPIQSSISCIDDLLNCTMEYPLKKKTETDTNSKLDDSDMKQHKKSFNCPVVNSLEK